MLDLLFRCSAGCKSSPTYASFPLCALCHESLVPCPAVCARCADLSCPPHECLRPWRGSPEATRIRSFSARYLLVGRGLKILKRWKTSSGAVFERRILQPGDAGLEKTIDSWRTLLTPIEIVPVGQDPARAWRLGGSPAERVSSWLSSEAGIPWSKALRALPRTARQGELDRWDRMKTPPRFEPTREVAPRIILVDDFMTTGRTIEAASRVLARAGAQDIHVFCLGLRPALGVQGESGASPSAPDS